MQNQKRVLVTGLSGFTGQYVANELTNAGYDVYSLDRPNQGALTQSVNLLDKSSLAAAVQEVKPNVVIHLAGIAFVGHGDPNAFYEVNLIGTRNLLEALAPISGIVECVLLASSANVYGNTEGVLSESSVPNPANDYAVSKLAMEYMAKLWMNKLPIVIARPFNYTGVGQSANFLLPKIIQHFQRAEPEIELGNIDVERDFSDVRTISYAYRRLVEIAPAGKTFNICSENSFSLKDILKIMGEIAGYEIQVKVNPAFVRSNEVKQLVGDASQLKACIGPINPISLSETLQWMYSSIN